VIQRRWSTWHVRHRVFTSTLGRWMQRKLPGSRVSRPSLGPGLAQHLNLRLNRTPMHLYGAGGRDSQRVLGGGGQDLSVDACVDQCLLDHADDPAAQALCIQGCLFDAPDESPEVFPDGSPVLNPPGNPPGGGSKDGPFPGESIVPVDPCERSGGDEGYPPGYPSFMPGWMFPWSPNFTSPDGDSDVLYACRIGCRYARDHEQPDGPAFTYPPCLELCAQDPEVGNSPYFRGICHECCFKFQYPSLPDMIP
jgi:hypothetical protein